MIIWWRTSPVPVSDSNAIKKTVGTFDTTRERSSVVKRILRRNSFESVSGRTDKSSHLGAWRVSRVQRWASQTPLPWPLFLGRMHLNYKHLPVRQKKVTCWLQTNKCRIHLQLALGGLMFRSIASRSVTACSRVSLPYNEILLAWSGRDSAPCRCSRITAILENHYVSKFGSKIYLNSIVFRSSNHYASETYWAK